jgi:hypothetical protein
VTVESRAFLLLADWVETACIELRAIGFSHINPRIPRTLLLTYCKLEKDQVLTWVG